MLSIKISSVCVSLALISASVNLRAASGEMGHGVPEFGLYSAATGASVIVWSLMNPYVPFPAGCTSLTLRPGTMGMDSYRAAIAILLMAKATNRPVKFYAHAQRDDGCGVDYVQLT